MMPLRRNQSAPTAAASLRRRGVARPRGFEPLTSAFGGQFPRFAVVSWVLRRFVKYPSGGHYLYVDDCLSLLQFVSGC
jgi:hypothetical protein